MQTMKERHKVEGVTLSLFSKDEVEKMSEQNIEDDQIYKENGDPILHGINSDKLGTMDRERLCKTCLGTQVTCPGHFGHIALARPVYHGNMLDYIRKVLRCVCFKCSHLLCDFENAGYALRPDEDYEARDEAIEDNYEGGGKKSDKERRDTKQKEFKETQRSKNSKSRFNAVFKCASSIKKCGKCQAINHIYRRNGLKIEYIIRDDNEKERVPDGDKNQQLWPEQAYYTLDGISSQHLINMGFNKETSNPANMIIHNLTVAPPPVRPSVAMSNSKRTEDDLTVAYRQIIKQNNEIKKNINDN